MLKTKKDKIKLMVVIIILLVGNVLFLKEAYASGPLVGSSATVKNMMDQNDAFEQSAGFDANTKTGDIIALIIQVFLSLLAIIFIILILYAGFNWMTAGGDEQKVTKAKDTIYRAVIGLVITLAAFAITYFVFNALPFTTGTPTTTAG